MYDLFHWLQRAYQKFHLSYVLPFVILISYTLLGAAIFRSLELGRDLSERELFRKSYYYAFDQITRRILELRCEDEIIKYNESLQLKYAEEAVEWFLDYLNFTSVINERSGSSPWSWYGSMFYAGQLYTTIGYGLPATKTLAGQIASIFYIMFGIPIFLIILKDVGQLLSRSFRKFYKRMRITRRKSAESLRRVSMSVRALYNRAYFPSTAESLCSLHKRESMKLNPEVSTLIQNKRKFAQENAFPIPIALAMLILWIGLSAALFCLYEREWGYLTSVYFFFVSISTVGLGDIVPDNKDMMLGYFLLILIGLALLSMCVNLIQVVLEKILGQLLREYIDEIERVAAIAKDETDLEAKASPFEVGMASGLLTAPLTKHEQSMRSLPGRIKDWIAERIATNMIDTQLAEVDSDVESDTETSVSSEPQMQGQQQHRREETQSLRLSFRHGDLTERLREHIPAIRTVQALQKARFYTANDDFQSVLFNKFVTNSKLGRYVDQVSESTHRVSHVATQTDFTPRRMLASVEEELRSSVGDALLITTAFICWLLRREEIDENATEQMQNNGDELTSNILGSRDLSSFQTQPHRRSTQSTSNSCDVESVFSDTYYDIQFAEAYAPFVIIDDTVSIDSSIASAQPAKVSVEKSYDISLQRRQNQQHSTKRPRPKSCQSAMPIRSNDATMTALPPPPPCTRPSHFGRIRSLPSCFHHSLSQSTSPLSLKRCEGERYNKQNFLGLWS